jgi:hypothetical protein
VPIDRFTLGSSLVFSAILLTSGCRTARLAGGPSGASVEVRRRNELASATAGGAGSAGERPSALLRARVESVARAFSERGARWVDADWTSFLGPDEARVARVRVERAQCVGVVAVGVSALRRVSLRVRDPSGVLLAEPTGDGPPYARLCARQGASFAVMVRSLEGQGLLSLGLIVNPPLVAPDLSVALGESSDGVLTGPRTPRVPVGTDPTVEPAIDAVNRHRRRLGALGYSEGSEVRAGTVERGESIEQRFDFEAGRCYGLLVTTDSDADPITFELRGPDGRVVVPARPLERDPLVRGCLAETGAYTARLSAREPTRFAAQALQLQERSELPGDVIGEVRAGVLELAGEAAARGLGRLRTVHRVASVGVPISFALSLRAQSCALVGAAVSGAGVDLAVLDALRGSLLGSDTGGTATPRVWVCASRPTQLRVSARPQGPRGEFALAIFDDGGPE